MNDDTKPVDARRWRSEYSALLHEFEALVEAQSTCCMSADATDRARTTVEHCRQFLSVQQPTTVRRTSTRWG